LTATERFISLVQGHDATLPLDEAALLMAHHAEPDLDVSAQLHRLDGLADQVGERSDGGVVDLLFGRLGIRGNEADYTDPRNSFLDQVLDRGLGIPISLAVLTMEVGRRVGVTVEGVGMPGHFLVRCEGIVRDPFRGGQVLDPGQVESLFRAVHGPAAPFTPAMLASTPPRAIMARMLANLRNSYAARSDPVALAWVATLMAAVPGVPPAEQVRLAGLLVEVGRFAEAGDVLDRLAGSSQREEGRDLRAKAGMLRARLN
jgi:regulator of sirC expression with transglutaminase-like and TPR domain